MCVSSTGASGDAVPSAIRRPEMDSEMDSGKPPWRALQPSHVSPTLRVAVSARPVGLQVSAPAAWDKTTINCRPAQRARGTKSPTRRLCPQTRPETNVTALAQKGIIRPMSLNTFTYLRAFSALGFVLGQKKGGREQRGRSGGGGSLCCSCLCARREESK